MKMCIGAWKDFYEVQRLKNSGEVDTSYEEEAFETPEKVLGYVSEQIRSQR